MTLTNIWKSDRAKRLCQATGFTRPDTAIAFKTLDLVKMSGITKPPVNPRNLSFLRGVIEVKKIDMPLDGRIYPTSKGYIIELRKDIDPLREKFVHCHETAHTFFFELDPRASRERSDRIVGAYSMDKEEERLCDIAAGHMLIPDVFLDRLRHDIHPCIDGFIHTSEKFATSHEITARRLTNTKFWTAVISLWEIIWEGSKFHLKKRWEWSGSVSDFTVAPAVAERMQSVVETLSSGKTAFSYEKLCIGFSPESYYTESKLLQFTPEPLVLTMIVLEPDAKQQAEITRSYLKSQ